MLLQAKITIRIIQENRFKVNCIFLQKYTEKYRNTVKTGLIYITVSQIAEKNSSQEQKGTKNQEIYLTNLTKFVKETFSESIENTDKNTSVENPLKRVGFFLMEFRQ